MPTYDFTLLRWKAIHQTRVLMRRYRAIQAPVLVCSETECELRAAWGDR